MVPFRRTLAATAAITLTVLASAGCGTTSELPPTVDLADAGRELTAALDAWKKGEPHASMTAKAPPVVFSEPLWEGGTRLLSFELGAVELHGRQARCTAKLALQEKSGKQYERKIGYQIDTTPRVVIAREGLGL